MIPVGWLFALNHVVPGALLLLGVSWLLAMLITRRLATRSARRLADQHALTGEDRQNFLAWSTQQKSIAATAQVFPVAVLLWCSLLALSVFVSFVASGGPGAKPDETRGDHELPLKTAP